MFLVAIYECYEYHALENAESNRLFCSKGQWIGTRPVCARVEGSEGDGEDDNDEPGDCEFEIILYRNSLHFCSSPHNRRLLRASTSCRFLILERTKEEKNIVHFTQTRDGCRQDIRRFFTHRRGTPLHINLLITNAKNTPFSKRMKLIYGNVVGIAGTTATRMYLKEERERV